MRQPQNQTLFITHNQLNLQPFQLIENIMASGRNWWLKDFERQAQYYGIRDRKKRSKDFHYLVEEKLPCEDSLPDLDNHGDFYERMVQKLNNHFEPRKNKRHARFRLRQNQQKSRQTIMQFYLECRELVRDCQYGNMEDELLLDHLIFEIKNDRLREKAIEEEWNLQRFLEVASRQLASSRQADEISGSINIKKEPEDVDRIRKIKHKNPKKRMQDAIESMCGRCGIKHQPGYCKALGQVYLG